MGIGFSIFLIALGAVFKFALTDTLVWGVKLDVVGLILMIVGAIGLIASLFVANAWGRRRETVVARDDRDVV